MSGALSEVASLLFGGTGSIKSGSISVIPDLVAREDHRDSLAITNHPVELGATISDHAFKEPAQLRLEYGWSNASLRATVSNFTGMTDFSVSSLLSGNWGEAYVNQVYEKLLSLQAARTLCTIVTNKRLYKNMLIESAETFTDVSTAYSMHVAASCREIIIVSTQTASTGVTSDNQANPASTAPVSQTGTKQLQSATNQSSLSQVWSSIQSAI